MHIEEEGQSRRKLVDLQAAFERSIYIGQSIGNSEGQFLNGGSSRLANMVATDADGIPTRHMARAKLDGIRHQAHGRLRWEKKLFLRAVLLEDIVLQRAAQLSHREATLLCVDNIHSPDDRGRAINRHRGGYFIERQAIEQDFHVGQRRDGNAAFAEFSGGEWVVGVISIKSRHIKSSRETCLTLGEQIFEALVGVFGGAETSKHTHGPGFSPVHGRLDATGIGVFSRQVKITSIVYIFVILRCIHAIDRHA